jgi:hypothetical protein
MLKAHFCHNTRSELSGKSWRLFKRIFKQVKEHLNGGMYMKLQLRCYRTVVLGGVLAIAMGVAFPTFADNDNRQNQASIQWHKNHDGKGAHHTVQHHNWQAQHQQKQAVWQQQRWNKEHAARTGQKHWPWAHNVSQQHNSQWQWRHKHAQQAFYHQKWNHSYRAIDGNHDRDLDKRRQLWADKLRSWHRSHDAWIAKHSSKENWRKYDASLRALKEQEPR